MDLLHPILPPIAMLHLVSDSIDESLQNWCISRKNFLQLLDHLETNSYQTTHFAEIIEKGKQSRSLSKPVVLTFDDCAKQLLDFAVPELVKRKMKATFYMPTAYIGGYNSWDAAKSPEKLELMNEADLKGLITLGMEVGSHSHHHVEMKNITDIGDLKRELTESKQILECITGEPVYSFAYPYGSVPNNYRTLLGNAGYCFGLSIYQPFETRFALRRFGIYNKDTTETLARKLSGRYKWMRKIYDVVKKN
jgi:peptidoglycan/xylan/chitin deacetylase (PgdA/CDA1 family)